MHKKMKIIPIFVPHVGCPNDCVFCNQKVITGKNPILINQSYVKDIVETYKKTIEAHEDVEIAFFGGSFTAIDIDLQTELLETAKYYKDLGVIKRIRCSTRPDAITEEILNLQKKYGVDIIELGIQSLDDDVLRLSNRGHNSDHSKKASELIKKFGFLLGHQIMPGLPGSTKESDVKTCQKSIKMQPDIVRIYPTLVIDDTYLKYMYENGEYKGLELDEAVNLCAYIYSLYSVNNINVIRVGLQNTDTIDSLNQVVTGPFHPAFGQLVKQHMYFSVLKKYFENFYNSNEIQNRVSLKDSKNSKMIQSGFILDIDIKEDIDNIIITDKNTQYKSIVETIEIYAPQNLISLIVGQKKENINKLKEKYKFKNIKVYSQKEKEKIEQGLIEIYTKDKYKICSFKECEIFESYLKFEG